MERQETDPHVWRNVGPVLGKKNERRFIDPYPHTCCCRAWQSDTTMALQTDFVSAHKTVGVLGGGQLGRMMAR